MSNPLKKTMVYLGLADEELEYDAPAASAGAAVSAHRRAEHGRSRAGNAAA
jgi:cell division inhibitor SepF